MTSVQHQARLLCGNRLLDLTRPQVMGILNVTPDSFSDGGRFHLRDSALRHAAAMVAAGASLIDVGGESTRPGALPVSAEQELQRVAPIVEALGAELDVIISVDTSSPLVILETARLGAGLINDVRALRRDGALLAAASTGLPVCLMHMQGEPGSMQHNPHYVDLLAEVGAFFAQRLTACAAAGIQADQIILDPGFGFAKNLQHNLSLFKHLQTLQVFGRPLLVGVSRKSMIGQTLGREVDQRLAGGLALAALALAKGAKILRVHDVPETVDLVRMIAAVEAAE
jgi:dihydropteroate synthase